MAKYYRQNIRDVKYPQQPPLGPLSGQQLGKESRVVGTFRGQDKAAALGRRVIATQCVRGDSTWLVPDTNPTSASNTHPNNSTARPVAYAYTNITPGHFLEVYALVIPAGETQVAVSGATYEAGGAGGEIQVDVTWNTLYPATSSETTTHTRTLPASALQYGAEPADFWASLKVVRILLAAPSTIASHSELYEWTSHSSAEITISNIGGARIVDCCVAEVPWEVAREADDAGDLWTSHIYSFPGPDDNHPDSSYPWQRQSEVSPDGWPMGGTWHLMNAANAQGLRLGPHLFSWTAWTETDASPSDTEIPPWTSTSASFASIFPNNSGAYTANEPGWSLATGAYARRHRDNHPYWSAVDGSIPVIVAVYGGGDAGTDGTVRVQSSEYSWVDCSVATGAGAWNFAYGHLRVGRGPGTWSVAQAFGRRDSGASNFNVYSISVLHAGQYPQP